jgi:hypothetical protein
VLPSVTPGDRLLLALIATASAASRGGVGVGFVGELWSPTDLSAQLVGRLVVAEHLSLELSGRVSLVYQPVTPFDEGIGRIAGEAYGYTSTFAKPITGEPAALTALVDWGFEPRPSGPGLTGGLHLLAGPEGRLALDYVAKLNPDYYGLESDEVLILSEPTVRVVVGAAVGFGLYVYVGERVTLRVTLLDHLALEPERAWDDAGTPGKLRLTSTATTSTDVVVAF